MSTVNEKMTALADEVRELSGSTELKGIDEMTSDIASANDEIVDQAELIAQIAAALEGKATTGNGEDVTTEVNAYTAKITSLETAVTALEEELAGKTAGGSGNNEFLKSVIERTVTEITASDLAGIEVIGPNAFSECYSLTTIDIPDSVTAVGNSAFYYCSNLTSITIPNSVTGIDPYAFASSESLTNVTIGNSISMIDFAAFAGCPNLQNFTILAIIPPELFGGHIFGDHIPNIYVPAESVNAYKEGGFWSVYADHIFAITESAAEVLEGDGQEYYTMAPSTLSFRSTAPLDEFQEVQVNGQTIDPSNYTLEEGSTIVKLGIDYLKTLNVGQYDIAVKSNSKTAGGNFTVAAPVLNEYGFYYNQPYTFNTSDYPEYTWGVADGEYCVLFKDASTAWYFFRAPANSLSDYMPWVGTICEYSLEGARIVLDDADFSFSSSFTNAGKTMLCDTFCVVIGGGGLSKEWLECSGISLALSNDELLADRHCLYSYDTTNKTCRVEDIFSRSAVAIIAREVMDAPVTNICCFSNTGFITTLILPDTITSIPDYFLTIDDVLMNIVFQGTVAQWNAIDKGKNWAYSTHVAYVQCTDGQVAL